MPAEISTGISTDRSVLSAHQQQQQDISVQHKGLQQAAEQQAMDDAMNTAQQLVAELAELRQTVAERDAELACMRSMQDALQVELTRPGSTDNALQAVQLAELEAERTAHASADEEVLVLRTMLQDALKQAEERTAAAVQLAVQHAADAQSAAGEALYAARMEHARVQALWHDERLVLQGELQEARHALARAEVGGALASIVLANPDGRCSMQAELSLQRCLG